MTTAVEPGDVRREVIMPDAMDVGARKAARLTGNNVSAYIRGLVASDLERRFGPEWITFSSKQELTDDAA